jgi:hypothetical protein
MPSKTKYAAASNLLTSTEIAVQVFNGEVSREWVRRHCQWARVALSPRKVYYRVGQVKRRYGR